MEYDLNKLKREYKYVQLLKHPIFTKFKQTIN